MISCHTLTNAVLQSLQTKVLQELGTVNNVVQLLGHGMVPSFEGQAWHAVLLRPFGKLLSTEGPAHMYKQAAFDIATAIGGSFAKHIRHQDISPYNMVVYKERVFLTDWSAGRVSHLVISIAHAILTARCLRKSQCCATYKHAT